MGETTETVDGAALDAALLQVFMTPEGQADPYPLYAQVREATPIHASSIGPMVLTRYDDCTKLLRDPRFGQTEPDVPIHEVYDMTEDAWRARFPRWNELPSSLLGLNPPDHTRLRGLVTKAFTPKTVEAMRPHIVELTDELLDELDGAGTVDIVDRLALRLPMTVIGELLGVPRVQLDELQPHVRLAVDTLDVRTPPLDTFEASHLAARVVTDAFAEMIRERHAEPTDDLLSDLVHVEEAGEQLTEPELLSLVLLLFGAGFETTTNLIGNGLRALLLNPDQLALLRDDPSLVRPAVEEMLRWDSPVQITGRNALEETEVLGVRVPAGGSVITILGAACRDPRRFDDPDRFDVARYAGGSAAPPPPMSFGGGIHFCLGAALARTEGAVAFERLLDRFAVIEPAWSGDEPPRYRDSTILRGLESLPVRLG